MTNWKTFRCAVEEAAKQALCDKNVVVQWANDSRYSSIRKLLLDVVSAVPTYNREEYSGDPIIEEFSTMMTITVQFRSEDIEPVPALDVAEKTRINLRRRYVREPLRGQGVVFVGMPGTTTPLDYTSDRRTVHTHVFETVFNFVFITDTSEIQSINSVVIDGELETTDNVVVPVDLTVTQP